jgi:predicted adenylyl cyclase CyaB
MSFLNIEIKARCQRPEFVRQWLIDQGARFVGTDQQTDTYFQVSKGRLKLREGNIENNLIYYERADQNGPKSSVFELFPVEDAARLKQMLSASLGIKVVVKKKREIYFIDNVKFHIDEVPGLGHFVEIEAGNLHSSHKEAELREQCNHYMRMLEINPGELLQSSYSDMLLP